MKKLYLDIHNAIHANMQSVKINGEPVRVERREEDNLRYVLFKDVGQEWEIMEQNPKAQSVYAERARNGEKLSWLIPRYHGFRMTSKWQLIENKESQ